MRINKNRLVETASAFVDVHSFTGDEQRIAELMAQTFEDMGLQVQWQQVEEGRANALGTLRGTGGGRFEYANPAWGSRTRLPRRVTAASASAPSTGTSLPPSPGFTTWKVMPVTLSVPCTAFGCKRNSRRTPSFLAAANSWT